MRKSQSWRFWPSEMQSVAISRSISSVCGMDGILARFLERGEKLVRIWLKSDLPNVVWLSPLPATSAIWMSSSLCAQDVRSEEHTSELQSLRHLVCRLL